jgi:hypothetical protein
MMLLSAHFLLARRGEGGERGSAYRAKVNWPNLLTENIPTISGANSQLQNMGPRMFKSSTKTHEQHIEKTPPWTSMVYGQR